MRFLKRCLFSLVVFLALLTAADAIIGYLGPGEVLKIQLLTHDGEGHCYSSDPLDALPLRLHKSTGDWQAVSRIIRNYRHTDSPFDPRRPPEMNYLRRVTPHCVLYHKALRRRGFFPRRSRKVAIVGDSFTYGEGVADEQTLGYLLAQAYPGINFPNLGLPGINIHTVRGRIGDYQRQPSAARTVIYFYSLNDALVPDDVDPNSYCQRNDKLCEARGEPEQGFGGRILKLSNILTLMQRQRLLRERTRRVLHGFQEAYFSPRNKLQIQDTVSTLAAINRDVSKRGGRLHVVIYPVLYRLNAEYPFESIHRFLLDVCKQHGLSCVDGYLAFEDRLSWKEYRVHPADSHPNGRANKRLVEHLTTRLKL